MVPCSCARNASLPCMLPPPGNTDRAADWQFLVILRIQSTSSALVVPIRDLRAWGWLPGTHKLLVVREVS